MNPYTPPFSDVRRPVIKAAPPVRRPASSKWTIALFAMPVIGALFFNGRFIYDHGWGAMGKFYLSQPLAIIRLLLCVLGFMAFVAGARKPVIYVIGVLGLGWISFNLISDILQDLKRQLGALATPEAQGSVIGGIGMALSLAWLFVRFTFGLPSRLYYRISPASVEEEKVGRPS